MPTKDGAGHNLTKLMQNGASHVKFQGMCTIDGCAANPIAKGLCSKHYMRVRRGGDASKKRKKLLDVLRDQFRRLDFCERSSRFLRGRLLCGCVPQLPSPVSLLLRRARPAALARGLGLALQARHRGR